MGTECDLNELIAQIYEAATAPDRLADLSGVMAPHFGTESSIIHTCTPASLEMRNILAATSNLNARAWSAYADHYHDRNVWFQRGIRTGPSVVVICEELVPHSELLSSEWYDYCHALDWFHCLGIGVSIDKELVGGIGFHRPRAARHFDEADRRKAQYILPHLERALQLNHRIASLTNERDIVLDVMDGLAVGILLVAANGRLLFANRIAEQVLQSGEALTVAQGRLRSQNASQRTELDRLIGEAAQTVAGKGTKAGGMLSLVMESGRGLPILVSPFRSVSIGYGPALPTAVVIFSDPAADTTVPEEALRSLFGLSPAEARLVKALLAGRSLSEYARAARISINTTKTQMRQVFAKTGYDRQVDLVRAIAANPVMKLAGR